MINHERTLEVLGYNPEEVSPTALGFVKRNSIIVVSNCPICSIERQLTYRQARKNKPCSKCFHNTPKMVAAKHNQNKIKSELTKQKMKDNNWSKKGTSSPFKGREHSEETRSLLAQKQTEYMASLPGDIKTGRYIKSSCTFRGLSIQDFDGWSTEESQRIRGSKEYKEWEFSVLKRDEKCVFPGCLERRRSFLTAHHKDGFNWCVKRRFDVSNGALLCHYHHCQSPISFHSTCGRGDNTEEQFKAWIQSHTISVLHRRDLYLVTGAPGIGKSWVCSQLNQYEYISYDDIPKEQHLYLMLKSDARPIIYDPWRKATSFVKRYKDVFDIKLIVILEDIETLKSRLEGRGGTFDENTVRYYKRAQTIAKGADFSGSSQQVLDFLRNKHK